MRRLIDKPWFIVLVLVGAYALAGSLEYPTM